MREKLIEYVHNLFRNAADTPRNRELEEEVLQNTLDRYDDLLSSGAAPESAYAQAVANIGNVQLLMEEPEESRKPQPTKRRISKAAVIALAVIGALVVALVLLMVLSYAAGASRKTSGENIEEAVGEELRDWAEGQLEDGYTMEIGNYYSAYEQEEQYSVGNAEVEAGNIARLMIDWVAGSVTIKPYDGQTISIAENEQEKEADRLRWRQEGDTLTIVYCASNHMMGIQKKDLTVLVPAELAAALKQVQVDTVSAEVWISGLQAELLQLWSVSGSQHAAGVYDTLEMDTASGGLEFSEIARKVELNTVSGNVEMKLTETPEELSFDSTSGSLTLHLPENRSFEAELETVSGDLTSELGTVQKNEVEYATAGQDRPAELEFDTVSGSVEIRKNKV